MSDLNINDYGDDITKSAKKYLKQNQDAITELIDQAYYQGSDDKSDEFAKNTMTELFIDTIKAWIKTEEEAKDNTWAPQYEVGFTHATIKQLQNIADTASMYYLVNDVDLEKAAKYFQDNYGDTEPTDLLIEIKDILAV